jgi:predicted DNA-binding transcriptional regulator AlpA
MSALAYPPRLMKRPEAARYIGVSESTFDRLVEDGDVPPGKPQRGCVTWDIRDLDAYADRLPYKGEAPETRRGPVGI